MVHMCLQSSDTDVYIVHNESAKKGENKKKSTAVCRTCTAFAKFQLALCFVCDYKGLEGCLFAVNVTHKSYL